MAVVSEFTPEPQDLAQAIEGKDRDGCEYYLAQMTVARAELLDEQTRLLTELSEKRNALDICKAKMKNIDSTVSTVKSVMYGWGRT